MRTKACLTKKSDLWQTPKKLYDYYKNLNYFDPCPINPQFNGLKISWQKTNFVNPPYSQIEKWITKAIIESEKGNETILLIPARTDTKWFRKLVEKGAKITFIQGKLHFNDTLPAPFPSMLVIIYKDNTPYKPQFNFLTKENRYWENLCIIHKYKQIKKNEKQ